MALQIKEAYEPVDSARTMQQRSQIIQLQYELSLREKGNAQLQAKLEQITQEHNAESKRLREIALELQSKLSEAQSSMLGRLRRDGLEEQVKELQTTNEQLKSELQNLREVCTQAIVEKDEYIAHLEERSEGQVARCAVEDRLYDLQEKHRQQLDKLLDQLQAREQELSEQKSRRLAEKELHEERFKQLEQNFQEMIDSEEQSLIEQRKGLQHTFNQEAAELKEAGREQALKAAELEKELLGARLEKEACSSTVLELQAQLRREAQKCKELEGKLGNNERELRRLQEQLTREKGMQERLGQGRAELQNRLLEVESERRRLQEQLGERESRLGEAQHECSGLRLRIKELLNCKEQQQGEVLLSLQNQFDELKLRSLDNPEEEESLSRALEEALSENKRLREEVIRGNEELRREVDRLRRVDSENAEYYHKLEIDYLQQKLRLAEMVQMQQESRRVQLSELEMREQVYIDKINELEQRVEGQRGKGRAMKRS